MHFPKINSVAVLDDLCLSVTFENNITKKYDCLDFIKQHNLSMLRNKSFFNQVKVDIGGYGISWDEDIDIAESELWINGHD